MNRKSNTLVGILFYSVLNGIFGCSQEEGKEETDNPFIPDTAKEDTEVDSDTAYESESYQEEPAKVRIKNDFNNAELGDYQPPWTICESSYLDTAFGKIGIGEKSVEKEVSPGLDYVLMVAAWDDPDCASENCLPIASKNEEEVIDGQIRTIEINLPNHQGPCPPEGTPPIPRAQYDRILAIWPEYNFKPYEQRTENTVCLVDK